VRCPPVDLFVVFGASAAVLCRESRLVFYKTIIHIINILFVTCELCITLILLVYVAT
jgi:hypothetical protein